MAPSALRILQQRETLSNSVMDIKLQRMLNITHSLVDGAPIESDDELSIHFVPPKKLPHAKVNLSLSTPHSFHDIDGRGFTPHSVNTTDSR